MLRLSPGGWGSGLVDVPGKKLGQVEFRPGKIPSGMIVMLDSHGSPEVHAQSSVMVEVSRGVKPGRYFIGLAATADGQTASTEMVVDVVPE